MVRAQQPFVILSAAKDLGTASKKERSAFILLLCQDSSTPYFMLRSE